MNQDLEPITNVQRDLCPELEDIKKTKGLRVVHMNVRGLELNFSKLCEYFNHFENIDIFGVTETHLNENSLSNISVQGFTFLNKRRNNGRGGGVGVYISEELNVKRRYDLETEEIECIWFEIVYPNTKSFIVSVMYRPPDTSNYLSAEFNNILTNKLTSIATENKELVVIGDINCNYHVKEQCKDIKNIFSLFGLKQLIRESTRVTENTSTLIDLILSNKCSTIVKTSVIPCDISDHCAIGFVRKINSKRFSPKLKSFRNYKNLNIDMLRTDVEDINWEALYSTNNVTQAWNLFKNAFLNQINKHAPIVSKRIRGRPCPWLTEELSAELNKKDQLFRKAKKSQNPLDWNVYKIQRNKANNLLRKTKSKYHQTALNENINKPDKFWKTVKTLYPNKNQSPNSSPIDLNTEKISTVNKFNTFFTNIATNLKAKLIPLKKLHMALPR